MGLTPITDWKKKKKKKKEESNECEKDVESHTCLFQIDSQEWENSWKAIFPTHEEWKSEE